MHLSSFQSKKQSGFTLTEIAIVLGIVGVILGAIWAAAASVNSSNKAGTAIKEVLNIVGGIQSAFPKGFPVGGQDLTSYAINSGIISNDMIAPCAGLVYGAGFGGTAGCAVLPWQTQLHVDSQTAFGGSPSATNVFIIWSATLTAAQCGSFLPLIVQQAAGNGLVWAFSTSTGGFTVDANTPITTFQNCSGQIGLAFTI